MLRNLDNLEGPAGWVAMDCRREGQQFLTPCFANSILITDLLIRATS
jgi:hypothetical protein